MTQSTYKIILSSDATRDSSRYIQHYGVKGMKWGVIRSDDEKRNSKNISSNTVIEKAMKIIDDLPADSKQKLESATKDFLKTKDGKQLQKKINNIVTNSSGEINDETIQEIMGVAVDMVQSEELIEASSELIDTVKDVALDELEKENPTLGKAAKAADNFIDSVKDFVADFTQSIQNIISGISDWFGNLFSNTRGNIT